MKRGKASGDDDVLVDILKDGGDIIPEELAKLFTLCIQSNQTPDSWNNALIILIHKKGDITDLKNYRPISLLSNTYKLFTKVLTNRITGTLDFNQPREQAGFRSTFSTTDHLHTLNQIIEKTSEYRQPLCLAFIDYEKAFDSIEIQAVITALQHQGVHPKYIKIIDTIYSKGTATIRLHKDSDKFPINRGVRQGDTISPKLFNAALEEIMRKLDWGSKGVNIDGERLNPLRFADDIVLLTEDGQDLEEMMNDLNAESNKVGLKINMKKTKVMFNSFTEEQKIMTGNTEIEKVDHYIYLGQQMRMDHNQMDEVKRRTRAGWHAFGNLNDIMRSKMPICLKRKVFNQCVLPAMTYGSETWAVTKKMEQKLTTAQHSMERSMLGITKWDRKTLQWIRVQTQVMDIIQNIKGKKWSWAGHLARTSDNRWTKRITEWRPWLGSRHRGRQKLRWSDDITKFVGTRWIASAQDRFHWCQLGEAFALQWADHG